MYVDFDALDENARIWVYQSDKKFTSEEVNEMSAKLELFINEWTRHGSQLKGSFKIVYQQFIIVAVDENFISVSGCAIDASVRQMKQFEADYGIQLFDKLQVAVQNKNGIETMSMLLFKEKLNEGTYSKNSIVFNNMVDTKKRLNSEWEVPVSESWHQRLLKV